ncbi:MAG: hypothetical protein HeimC3_48450 [Candidatus Heimdallarchaeota archaeon LC_3]|nr:MAG: hypothetical protein HeimC3_48450 [Candidatus Heimdallarchaeota archaeon LC_3]
MNPVKLLVDTNALFDIMMVLDMKHDMSKAVITFFEELKEKYSQFCSKKLVLFISNQWKYDQPKEWKDYKRTVQDWIDKGILNVIDVNRSSSSWKRYLHEYSNKAKDHYDIDLLFLALNNDYWMITSDSGILNVLMTHSIPFLTPYSLFKFLSTQSTTTNYQRFWQKFHDKQLRFRSVTKDRVIDLNQIRHEEDISFTKFIEAEKRPRIRFKRKTLKLEADLFEKKELLPLQPMIHIECSYYDELIPNLDMDCLNCKLFGPLCPKLTEEVI